MKEGFIICGLCILIGWIGIKFLSWLIFDKIYFPLYYQEEQNR